MRLLIVQHAPDEHAGRFRRMLSDAGDATRSVVAPNLARWPDMESFDALWVLGGAMQVWETDKFPWLAQEMGFIRRAVVAHGKPYLGICLGHQLLAAAFDAPVRPARTSEFGLLAIGGQDRFMPRADARQTVFQWHSAEVAQVPAGFEAGYSSAACRIQTMSGPPAVFSTQFHAEIDSQTMQDWYRNPDVIDDLVASEGAGAPERLIDALATADVALEGVARTIFETWRAAACDVLAGKPLRE